MITFSQLAQGDSIHVLEVTGTFKKSTNYCKGRVSDVSVIYEEQLAPQAYQIPNPIKKKLVDITISCEGEQKKLSVEEGKTIITDSTIGLTVATNKQQIVDMIKRQYSDYKAKKEAIARYDDEMNKCEAILKQLDYDNKEEQPDDPKIKELQDQVNELKGIMKQASNMVPPQMKQMLPQNMQNAMNEAS